MSSSRRISEGKLSSPTLRKQPDSLKDLQSPLKASFSLHPPRGESICLPPTHGRVRRSRMGGSDLLLNCICTALWVPGCLINTYTENGRVYRCRMRQCVHLTVCMFKRREDGDVNITDRRGWTRHNSGKAGKHLHISTYKTVQSLLDDARFGKTAAASCWFGTARPPTLANNPET